MRKLSNENNRLQQLLGSLYDVTPQIPVKHNKIPAAIPNIPNDTS